MSTAYGKGGRDSQFGRISGAPRRKTGFPLQVLGIADAIPVGFPLQSWLLGRAANLRQQIRDQPLAREKSLIQTPRVNA
jgi:hypothetical protein